jgi:tetratricopeptide (TPR) repeat protein
MRLFAVAVLMMATWAWAQDQPATQQGANSGSSGSQTNSGPSKTSPPQSQSSSTNSAKQPNQPLQPATPDELKFPEDDSSQPATNPSVAKPARTPSLEPPRSDRVDAQDLGPATGESSSKDEAVDVSAPSDDAKNHPQSSEAVTNAETDSLTPSGVTELHTWDPHQAAKDVEVGDFYFKRGNYHAAEARYRDALLYKNNDAIATFRLAECLEKQGILDDARAEYQSYLKILPHGPQAEKAEKGIVRIDRETAAK